jgi:hypothetical protein
MTRTVAKLAAGLVGLVAFVLALPRQAAPAETETHWAFRPVRRPNLPEVHAKEEVRNPIDAFLLAKLEERGLSFSPEASKRDLIRRLKFDLLGLPPTPQEIAAFEADEAPDAYERLVERLLASPHYGEQWGRYWLDVVRYAETAGFNADPLRPLAWKYRDYVIGALNADTPYDRFIQEQIAGDELFPDDPEALIATGYVLMWPDESNASNILLARQDSLNDLTANVGSVFLGVSIGCAQCHDHKFDPLPQRDFYRLQAFFSGIVRCDKAPLGKTSQLAAYHEALSRWLDETAALRDELHRLETPARVKAAGDRRMKFPAVVLEAIDRAPENRTAYQRQLAFWSERQLDIKEEVVAANLSEEQRQRRAELQKELAKRDESKPRPPGEVLGMIVGELEAEPPPTFLLAGGSYDKKRDEVAPGFLTVLAATAPGDERIAPPHSRSSGRRSVLARWLTDPANPLVPRVIVNRLWQGHFGKGLLENANDFGTQTAPPSHPELLDWLAAELINPGSAAQADGEGERGREGERERGRQGDKEKGISGLGLRILDLNTVREVKSEIPNPKSEVDFKSQIPNPKSQIRPWSLKSLHRLIVTSSAYRQSTYYSALRTPNSALAARSFQRAIANDPSNRLYWHFDRRRLSAENIRDGLLSVAGLLNSIVSGPSVYPELPPDFSKREAWKVSTDPADRARRSVYIHAKRNLPYPLLEAFDLPDMHESCARRSQTTVAPQSLMLLNSDLVVGYSQAFAGRLLEENPHADLPPLIESAYQLAFGRAPSPDEIDAATRFISRQQSLLESERAHDRPLLLPRGFPKFLDPFLAAALTDFCHALMNANEFVYVD